MFAIQMGLGTAAVVALSIFHAAGLVLLAGVLARIGLKHTVRARRLHSIRLLALSVLAIVAIHSMEAWAWAGVYMAIGEFDQLEPALYFSIVTATTLGFGDVTLSEQWQLLSTFEAMGGLILFGASTAFLMEILRRLFFGTEAGSPDALQNKPVSENIER